MTILRIRPCKRCRRRGELKELVGGWEVFCYYSHPIHCVENNEDWCDVMDSGELHDSPHSAIFIWNVDNPPSGIEHKWDSMTVKNIDFWHCSVCEMNTTEFNDTKIRDCIESK